MINGCKQTIFISTRLRSITYACSKLSQLNPETNKLIDIKKSQIHNRYTLNIKIPHALA